MQDERTQPKPIGDRVKQLRKDHGLTQEDLAAKSGLGVATIQRVRARRESSRGDDRLDSIIRVRFIGNRAYKPKHGRRRRAGTRELFAVD
jgi:transcriptional regulator with XRE-family HTH domain